MKKFLWSCNDVRMTPKLVISHRVQKWQLLHMKIMQNYCFFFVKKSKYSIWRSCCHRNLMVFHQCRSLHNKQNNTWLLGEIWNLSSRVELNSVCRLFPALTQKILSCTLKEKFHNSMHSSIIFYFLGRGWALKSWNLKNPPQLVQ